MYRATKQPALARNAEDSRDGKRDTKAPKSNKDDETNPSAAPNRAPIKQSSSHQYHSLPGPSQPFASSNSTNAALPPTTLLIRKLTQ